MMRNIINIIRDDFRAIFTNIIAIVVIVGITVIPSMYAWFNISASWDPYSNTRNLDIALASEDEGYNGRLSTVKLELGNAFITSIQKKDSFNWVMTDPEEAKEGVRSGRYYAAIVIDKSFSSDLMSVFEGHNIRHAGITYYQNEKENAIASKVTTKGVDSVQQTINDTFAETIFEALLGTLKVALTSDTSEKLTMSAAEGITESLRSVKQQIGSLELAVKATYDTADTLGEVIGSMQKSQGVNSATLKDIKKRIAELDAKLSRVDISKLPASDIRDDLLAIRDNIDDIKKSISDVESGVRETGEELAEAEKLLAGNGAALRKKLKVVIGDLDEAQSDIDGLISRLDSALESEDLEKVKTILGEDAGALSEYLASPVGLDTRRVYPVENYGSAMAPFYSSLAIWVGGTVLVAMLLVSLDPKRRQRYPNLTGNQIYLGRYFLFFIVGILQALFICAGDLWFLGIQCESPARFLLAGAAASFIFVNIAYTMTATFGDIGKAVCVILMVIQVAGSGGTFPVEMQPEIFQTIHALLPFTHSMDAMREAIMGAYGNVYWIELGKLMLYLIPNAIIGFVLRKPIEKAGEKFNEALEKTKVL